MQNIAPKTLFTGHQLVFLPECNSTNQIGQELIIKNSATEGCVIIAGSQTQGRGQRGNSWEAAPHQNLTLSIILKPGFLPLRQQFYLNIIVALAKLDLARGILPDKVSVKWPNDLYYENKKLGGVLIENSIRGHFIQHSVVGIGLNINQLSFVHPKAISFAGITGQRYHLNEVAERLLENLEARYLELKAGKLDKLRHEYLQHLYWYQELKPFKVGGEAIAGVILGITEEGYLLMQVDQQVRAFDFKEVSFLN